jgi:lysophospholipase L1-like esterase
MANCNNQRDVLRSISIAAKPDKVTYDSGEALDTTGLKVSGNYSRANGQNASSKIITGYTVTPAIITGAPGTAQTVTVSFTAYTNAALSSSTTYTATFTVTINGGTTEPPPSGSMLPLYLGEGNNKVILEWSAPWNNLSVSQGSGEIMHLSAAAADYIGGLNAQPVNSSVGLLSQYGSLTLKARGAGAFALALSEEDAKGDSIYQHIVQMNSTEWQTITIPFAQSEWEQDPDNGADGVNNTDDGIFGNGEFRGIMLNFGGGIAVNLDLDDLRLLPAAPASQLTSLSVNFDPGANKIYPTTPINNLKNYLKVTANYADNTSVLLNSSDYTLSGTLAAGVSRVTASYAAGGVTKQAGFNVTVAENAGSGSPVKIVVLGESFSDGYSENAADGYNKLNHINYDATAGTCPSSLAWPGQLEELFNDNGGGVTIANHSAAGATTAWGVAKFAKFVIEENPDILIIELCGNDLANNVPISTTSANIANMIQRLKAHNPAAKIYFLRWYGENTHSWFITSAWREGMNSLLATFSNTYGLDIISYIPSGLWEDMNMYDGLHPNVKGSAIIAEHVYNYIQGYVNTLTAGSGGHDDGGNSGDSGGGDAGGGSEDLSGRYLRVSGNKIEYVNNSSVQEVVLRGVNVWDFNHYTSGAQPSFNYIANTLHANAVRIPVHPGFWNTTTSLARLKTKVQEALDAGLFVIIDYHTIAYPDGWRNEYKEGSAYLYDASFAKAKTFWDTISQQEEFGDGRILFELWNEPVGNNGDGVYDKSGWAPLKSYWEQLIKIIRDNGKNNIVIAGGETWTHNLMGIKDNLIDKNIGNGIAYAWHIYTEEVTYSNPSKSASQFTAQDIIDWANWYLDGLNAAAPVLVTEWGYEWEDYAYLSAWKDPFRDSFLKAKNLHSFAWCYNNSYTPKMISGSSYPGTLNAFGNYVKDYLQSHYDNGEQMFAQ